MRRELMGLGLLTLAVVTLLSLFSITSGTVSDNWAALLRQLLGWGAIPATVSVGGLGVLLLVGQLRDESGPLRWDMVIGIELLFVAGLALLHLLVGGDNPLATAKAGEGGGLVGWGLSTLLTDLLGRLAAEGILALLLMAGVGLLLRFSAADAPAWMPRAGQIVSDWLGRLGQPASPEPGSRESAAGEGEAAVAPTRSRPRKKVRPELQALPLRPRGDETPGRPIRRPADLPPLDLLVPSSKDPAGRADARYQAQIIEETLHSFGVPAEVKEINVGPAVTQFGIEPGYVERLAPDGTLHRHRVRVSKISALANDLALALSAAPIRIEAPVPGRPFVGVEVPNSKLSLVSLRGVLESEAYRKEKGFLRIPLGRDVSGAAVAADLTAMPHLLVAGATGSGKSVCINAVVTGLLCDHPPDELKFLMVDPKMVELTGYNGVPHLLAPVITDIQQVVGALTWITRMMDERFQRFSRAGARNITDYNKRIGRRDEPLAHIVLVVDELADLMLMAPDETERYITRIAQMARATGIHMIIATQRPSVDVVTGLIKANFPARIGFAVTSQIDSRVILDSPGAERLLGRGDMLLMLPESPKLLRLQGCFVSDAEIHKIVNFWKQTVGELPVTVGRPWDGLLDEAGKDDLLEEAIAIVTKSGRASTTFLQRRLGIGYPRASRLMDQLEEEGIIGPSEGGRPRRVLMGDEDDYADESDEAWEDG